eukprot:403375813
MDHSPTTSYQSSAQLATSNKYSQSPNDPQNKISKLNVNLKASVVHGRYHHELRMRDQLDKVDKINEEIQRQFEVKRKSLLHEQMVQRFQDKQGTQSRNQQFKNGVTGSSSFKQSSKQGLQMSKSQNNRTGVTTRQGNQGAVESFMLKKLPDLNSQFSSTQSQFHSNNLKTQQNFSPSKDPLFTKSSTFTKNLPKSQLRGRYKNLQNDVSQQQPIMNQTQLQNYQQFHQSNIYQEKSTNSLQLKSKEELSNEQFKEFYSNEYVYTQTNQPRRESLLYLQIKSQLNNNDVNQNFQENTDYDTSNPNLSNLINGRIKDFTDKKRLFDQGSRENRSNLQTMRQSFLLKKSSQPSTIRTPQLDNISQNKSQIAQESQEFNRFEYENIREKMQKLKGHHILLKAGVNKSVVAQDKEIDSLLVDKQLNLPLMHQTYRNIRKQYGDRSRDQKQNLLVESYSPNSKNHQNNYKTGIEFQLQNQTQNLSRSQTYRYNEISKNKNISIQDQETQDIENKFIQQNHNNQDEEFKSSLAQADLKLFKYFGGEEHLQQSYHNTQRDNKQSILDDQEIRDFLHEKMLKNRNFQQSMIFINKNKQSKWLQKREQKSQSSLLDLSQKLKDKDSKDINLIMEKLFQYWDSQNINRVTIETFQEKMIVYGLASNDVISDRLLRLIKIQNKLDENIKFIKKVHFLNLLISNRFVQPLVDLIIKKVTDARMQEEMLQKQIRSRMGDNIKVQMSQNQDKNNRQVTPSKRNKNGDQTSQSNHQGIKKTQEVSFENLSQIKEEKQKSSQSPIKKLNDVSKSNITVSDAFNQVMLFWKDIENFNNNEIKKESLMNYLKLNRVISDRSQFDEFIKQTLMQEEVGFNQPMNKQQFMTIFCKPIFNIGLMNILKLSRVQKLKGAGLLCDQDPLSCQIVNHQKDMLYSSFDQTQASQFQQNRGNSMIDLLNSNQANQETNKHSQESFSQYNLFLDRQITSKSIPKTQQRYQTQSSLIPQYSPAFTPDINAKQQSHLNNHDRQYQIQLQLTPNINGSSPSTNVKSSKQQSQNHIQQQQLLLQNQFLNQKDLINAMSDLQRKQHRKLDMQSIREDFQAEMKLAKKRELEMKIQAVIEKSKSRENTKENQNHNFQGIFKQVIAFDSN